MTLKSQKLTLQGCKTAGEPKASRQRHGDNEKEIMKTIKRHKITTWTQNCCNNRNICKDTQNDNTKQLH